MKFIHCADLHLGSRLKTNLSYEKALDRRAELGIAFANMVSYAKKENVEVILLSGDIFDSDAPFKRDKAFFYDLVRMNKEIEFIYLKGNHDSKETYFDELPPNLKTFDNNWKTYMYGSVTISGIELNEDNKNSCYATLKLDNSKFNIVMMHGDISTNGKNGINISMLKNKNIDYLALGHIHQNSLGKLDDRGFYAYSGCLEGRGFDEIGPKGFYLVDTANPIETASFICNSIREYFDVKVDISSVSNVFEGVSKIENELKEYQSKDIILLNLIGNVTIEIKDLISYVKPILNRFYDYQIVDKTIHQYNLSDYMNDPTLKGEFIREVLNDNTTDESMKSEIITLGLKSLLGDEA